MSSNHTHTGDIGDLNVNEFVTNDGVFVIDHQQKITSWNASAERILGYCADEVVGLPCYEVVAGRDSQNYRFCRRNCPVVANARRRRPTPDYDVLCCPPSGQPKWLNISAIVTGRRGEGARVIHLFRDVTQRRSLEEFARKTSATFRNLLANEGAPATLETEPNPTPSPHLSRRELQVLRLLATGMKTRDIAEAMGVRPITARNHVTRVLTKLGVENRLQAVVYASDRHLI